MTKHQMRHHSGRSQGARPDARRPTPGQSLVAFPVSEQSLFGSPTPPHPLLAPAPLHPLLPPAPRAGQPARSQSGRRRRRDAVAVPLAVLLLGIALGAIVVVMLVAAGVPAPWDPTAPVASPVLHPPASAGATDAADVIPTTPAPRRAGSRTGIIGDGTYLVGVDLEPGRYVTSGVGTDCRWARLAHVQKPRIVVAAGEATARTTVLVRRTDIAFETTGCGGWTKR